MEYRIFLSSYIPIIVSSTIPWAVAIFSQHGKDPDFKLKKLRKRASNFEQLEKLRKTKGSDPCLLTTIYLNNLNPRNQ